jgi:hypothetical protein
MGRMESRTGETGGMIGSAVTYENAVLKALKPVESEP